MSLRRLAPDQPASFAFTPDNLAWAQKQMKKYPEGRQASAVTPLLWRAQEQNGGHVTEPMMRVIGEMLGMSPIRVLEIATFYTMFNLKPVGQHLLQVCTTTPCWLRGSDAVVAACKKHIHPHAESVSADGKLSWMEVECLGACVNAPIIQIGDDFYEDVDGARTEGIINDLRAGRKPKPGSQIGRQTSAPEGGPQTLTDASLYTKGG
ncbi:MAG: NADH-quinone oxidoreductase subunit NuoE [Alphaproteobacteria bacterium]|nr:NADH-quinone oxidoreductase subunit NuoE [Alphaproteobacteria bacterium]